MILLLLKTESRRNKTCIWCSERSDSNQPATCALETDEILEKQDVLSNKKDYELDRMQNLSSPLLFTYLYIRQSF